MVLEETTEVPSNLRIRRTNGIKNREKRSNLDMIIPLHDVDLTKDNG